MTLQRGESPTGTSSISASADSGRKRVLFVFGTRPEAIKLCPLIAVLANSGCPLEVVVCVTGQHREMLHQVLHAFNVKASYDLDVMAAGQTSNLLASRILAGLEAVFEKVSPALTIVQGDTTTTLCGALASFHCRVPIAHVEAGLRTYDLHSPFPEEGNRLVTDQLATLRFAATQAAADNLLNEGFSPASVTVTGNTGIDAVLSVSRFLDAGQLQPRALPLNSAKRLILVTCHRRESFGPAFDSICNAVAELANRDDIQIVWPVHPNPHIKVRVETAMHGQGNVLLLEPLDYVSFIDLMRRAYLILTDSGGIQEEAPSLGKPVLVLRDKTERLEALASGTAKLVGTSRQAIVGETINLLENAADYTRMAQPSNAYGDGRASHRIASLIEAYLFPAAEELT